MKTPTYTEFLLDALYDIQAGPEESEQIARDIVQESVTQPTPEPPSE